ncbi:hypothetical protein G9A89_021851 [Geosiphon pyriformis]|nr:hypothetical protein G9A89_021851 [Geosiphon pyriformis]
MKKTIKVSGSESGFKMVVSRKKKKEGVLTESINNREIAAEAPGDTIESKSIDMKKKCLVEETSVDYGESGAFMEEDPNQTPKSLHVKTKKVLEKPLGVIDYGNVNTDDDVLDDSFLLPPSLPIKPFIQVSVCKSFALNIDLMAIAEKSSQEKLSFIRKIFSSINGFGGAFTPSKFGEVIRVTFTLEKTIMAARKLTNDCGIVVNTNLKHPVNNRTNQDIVIKEISVGTSIEAMCTAVFEFGIVVSIKMQLADLLASKWSILIRKDATWDFRDEFKVLLYTFPQISINNITEKRPKTSGNICNKFKVATASDITTLEIIAFKKTLFQYIKNRINDYLFGNYNITTVKRDLLENILHYSNTESENISAEACATYFEELDYNIIRFCEEKYLPNAQFAFELESEPETSSNKRQKDNRSVHTTPNTPKISFKHLQTPEQGTTENQSEHSEIAANKENNSEITEEESINSENKEDEMTTYITKISEFNGKDIETSPQEWLDQVTKAGDANGWNAARMLRTIPYFLKGTAGEWFENLAAPFNDWNAFKAAFLEQFTDNNTSITLHNCFRNIKQEPSESVMTYIGKFNKLLKWICQLETNNYYSDAQILDQFITGLKDKLIKKVCSHAPEDLNSAIQHTKRYEMAMEEANHTKLVNLAIGETSSAAEEKIDQLIKKVENYFTNQQQQQPQRYQPPQRRNQNNFAPLSNNQPQNCHYCKISGHWKRDCKKLQRDQQNRGNQHYSSPQQSYYQPSPPAYYLPRPQYQNNYYQSTPQPIQQQYQQPPIQHYQVPA